MSLVTFFRRHPVAAHGWAPTSRFVGWYRDGFVVYMITGGVACSRLTSWKRDRRITWASSGINGDRTSCITAIVDCDCESVLSCDICYPSYGFETDAQPDSLFDFPKWGGRSLRRSSRSIEW